MNREKYESLKVVDLKGLCKARGVKDAYKLKKEELVELMLELDERDAAKAKEEEKSSSEIKAQEEEQPKEEKNSEISEDSVSAEGTEANDSSAKPLKKPGKRFSKVSKPRTYKKNTRFAKSLSEENETTEADTLGIDTLEESSQSTENSAIDSENPLAEGEENPDAESKEKGPQLPPPEEMVERSGILEVLDDGYGFLRSDNYLPGSQDIYVSPAQIHKFALRTGDLVVGLVAKHNNTDKYSALLYLKTINGDDPEAAQHRPKFERLTPIFPNSRIRLERPGCSVAMRIVDFISPIGKGQRGMIVSQPKAGKTTLLKQIAASVKATYPDMHLIILLIDERPEEVTDMKEAIEGDNAEVV